MNQAILSYENINSTVKAILEQLKEFPLVGDIEIELNTQYGIVRIKIDTKLKQQIEDDKEVV